MEDEEGKLRVHDPKLFRSKTQQPNASILSPVQHKRNDLKSSILTLNHPQYVDEADREKKGCICNLI